MVSPIPVIIDTDCALGDAGAKVDDGFALALALVSPELDVLLVTTTDGNVDVLTATARASALLDRLGRSDVPVVTGGCPDGAGAARAIAARAIDDPGAVTVVALGPLTTVACALAADERVAGALREVVAMGGRFAGPADASPEFNTRYDPWATRAVLESGVPVRFVGLDVTQRLALEPVDLARLDGGGPNARYLSGQARARLAVLAAEGVRRCPMHDPLAVVAVTHPHLLAFEVAAVTVDLAAGDRRGMTTARRPASGTPVEPAARIAADVDAAAAREVVLGRLCAA